MIPREFMQGVYAAAPANRHFAHLPSCPDFSRRYDGRDKWYLGNIAQVNPDGSFDVKYDSGMWNGWVSAGSWSRSVPWPGI